jgi:hypothetical protein
VSLNSQNSQNAKQVVNQLTSKIDIPKPNIVSLKNVKTDVFTTGTNSKQKIGSGQVLEVIQEPFTTHSESTNNSNWSSYDFLKIVILVIILVLLIFRK